MAGDTYLVTAEEIEAMPGIEKTHFLNEKAKRNNKSLGDLAGLTGFGFHIIEVQPGAETTEHHVHYHEDECVFVLEGQATAFIGETEHAIKAGDFIGYRKAGLAHSIRNTGSTPFKCIVVGQRLAHDVGDYTRLGKRIYRQEGLPWNLVSIEQIKIPDGTVGKKD